MGSRLIIVSCLVLLLSAAAPAQSGATSRPAPSGGRTVGGTTASRRRVGTKPLPRPSGPVDAESELARRLQMLQATRVPAGKSGSGKTAPPTRAAEPDKGAATSRPARAPTTRPAATTQPGATVKGTGGDSAAALARLKESVAFSEIPDLQALADVLYLAGRRKAATVVYERILEDDKKARDDKKPRSAADDAAKAWALYQLGNCYKSSDPDKAAGYFIRVQKEHGESTQKNQRRTASDWVVPAKVQADLIQWQQRNRPAELIRQASSSSKAS